MEGKQFKKYILLVIIPILMISYYQISRKFKLNDQKLWSTKLFQGNAQTTISEFQTINSAMRFLKSIPNAKTFTEKLISSSTITTTTSTSTVSTSTSTSTKKSGQKNNVMKIKQAKTIQTTKSSSLKTTSSSTVSTTTVDPEWYNLYTV